MAVVVALPTPAMVSRPGRRGAAALTIFRPSHSWSPRGVGLARAVAARLRPDLVHVQEQIHSFHETDAACRVADVATSAGLPLVTTLHEYHVELPSVRYTTELAGRSTTIIANDPRNADRCLAETGRAPDHRWWSGGTVAPPDPGSRPATVPGRLTTFGFIGGLKSLGLVGEALRLVREGSPEVHWKVIGPFRPESDPGHAALARDLATAGVEFTGALPDGPRLKRLLAESEVMLLPFADGASERRTTLHVAWAFGLPVITTPPPTANDAVVDGVNCVLVREPTADAWADADPPRPRRRGPRRPPPRRQPRRGRSVLLVPPRRAPPGDVRRPLRRRLNLD